MLSSSPTPWRHSKSVVYGVYVGRAERGLIAAGAALLLATLACSLQGAESQEGEVATAVALTLEAQTTQAAAAQPPTETPQPIVDTPEPEVTPTETLTATPAATATPAVPMISVSTDTNCRVGPGAIYDYRGALLVGETAEVIARLTFGNYWYIVNPDNPGEFCWLWGEYATVVGNTTVLPAFTPPPSPTPTHTPTATATPTPTP